jgi:non-canonical purine NTP pyrophosphatase (RdgB/HAM1 family)
MPQSAIEELLVATTNPGKAREFRQMLGDDRFTWIDSASLGALEVEETGRTFRDNACLKAAAYAVHFGKWTLADDSGLEVFALGGEPGVFSARYAAMKGRGEGDAANNALLLDRLDSIPDQNRGARFVCSLALADPKGRIAMTSLGEVAGRILREPRGSNGFGYDPLFFIDSLGQTTAELHPAQKHQISHRGQALRRLREVMDRCQLSRNIEPWCPGPA